MVVVMGIVSFLWGLNDLKSGSARVSLFSMRVEKYKEPFEYWIAVGSKFLLVPVAIFMLFFGLEFIE